jgi:hypothetical protein
LRRANKTLQGYLPTKNTLTVKERILISDFLDFECDMKALSSKDIDIDIEHEHHVIEVPARDDIAKIDTQLKHNAHHHPAAYTEQQLQDYLEQQNDDYHVTAAHGNESVLVTTLLKRTDSRYICPNAVAARGQEVLDLERRSWVDWTRAESLESWECRKGEGTWSGLSMLTSEKFSELQLPEDEATFKGRLVHQGDREFDHCRRDVVTERRKRLTELGLVVRPISGAELRTALTCEFACG